MAHLEVLADAACLVVPTSEPGGPAEALGGAVASPQCCPAPGANPSPMAAGIKPLVASDGSPNLRAQCSSFPYGTMQLNGLDAAPGTAQTQPVMLNHVAASPHPCTTMAMQPMSLMQTTCGMGQPAIAQMSQQMQPRPEQQGVPLCRSAESDTSTVMAPVSDEDKEEEKEEQTTGGQLDRPCAACRLSRVRCNRMFPCSRCTRLGLECKQPRKVQRGRPSHKARLARAQLQAQQAQAEAHNTMAQVHALTTHAPGPFSMHPGMVGAHGGGARPPLPWPAMSPEGMGGLAGHSDLPPPPPGMTTHERLTQLLETEIQHGHLLQVVGALRAQLRRLGSMPCA